MGFWFTFFLWAATFVISDYFRAKLPAQEPSGEGDFQSPTATEGRKVPQVVGGTVKVKGPNTLWYGDWEAVPVTVETGMIFKRDETVGYKYSVALALGQFVGRAAGMTAIYIGDDKVWDYVADNSSVPGTVADIDLPELFGGEKNGGGFQGRIRAFTGENNQSVSSYLASRVPLQSAWPGFVYVVITDLTETAGAIIGESNQLRDIRVEWQTYDTIANGGLGNELSLTGDKHIIGRDANPISAAYRVLNDADFSIATSDVNFLNFQAAADTCYTEGLGYSQLIDNELEAYEILAEIEKHIDGYIGPNPTNGLLEVNLARSGYTPANEFQATEDNIIGINNYAKPEWPQTKNEVKVRFVNREKDYKDDHAVAQDMAGRLIAGRPQSITIRFPGLRDATAANAIVTRTARAYFWPLAKFELELDRMAYAKRPGDIIMVTHPDIGAVDLPTRITRIRTGDPVRQTIKADVVEDVFKFETGIQAAPPASEHVPASDAVVAVSNWELILPPRWMFEQQDIPFEARVLYAVARDTPNNEWTVRHTTRDNPFGGNTAGPFSNPILNTFVPRGTLRGYGSPEVALEQIRTTSNTGVAAITSGGGFYVDGTGLAGLVGTYRQTSWELGNSGLAVIDPNGPNEEWVTIGTITADSGGIVCENVVRGIGDHAIKTHAPGEAVWFLDNGAWLQEKARTSDGEDDELYGLIAAILPYAPSGAGSWSANKAEISVNLNRTLKPYAPPLMTFDQISDTTFFALGDLDASTPDNVLGPTQSGIRVTIYNRRFDQRNQAAAAACLNDLFGEYPLNFFSDYNPTLNWWIYNLDTHPSPVRANAILSGTSAGLDDRKNGKFYDQSLFNTIAGLASTFNARFEFSFTNQASPGIDGVLAGVESEVLIVDRLISFYPDPESYEAIEDTLLLLHFNGFDGTTQVIDYSPYRHPVTLSGGVEIDTDISSAVIGSPDVNAGHLLHPQEATLSPETSPLTLPNYCEVTDVSPNAFTQMTSKPGFIIQCRVRFSSTPSGETPLVTKWRTSDNERQFWFGLSGTALRLKLSTTGTDEIIETTTAKTWTPGQWYEISVCVWDAPASGTLTYVYFYVDGAFSELEAFADDQIFHDSTAPVRIGSDGDGNTTAQTIYMDEVRIHALPLYKAPYTQQVVEFPGREYLEPLLFGAVEGWDDSPQPSPLPDTGLAGTTVTEDLNRWSMNFGSATGGSPVAPTTFLDTSQSKFGNASLRIGGQAPADAGPTNDGVQLTETSGDQRFAFNGDFTMEAQVRWAVLPSNDTAQNPNGHQFISKYFRNASPQWGNFFFGVSQNDDLFFTSYREGSNTPKTLAATMPSPSIQVNTWHHFAVCREGDALSLFMDGVRIGYDAAFYGATWPYPIPATDNVWLTIGRVANSTTGGAGDGARVMNGWLDEIRILNGTAAYSGATYTVPTAAFVRDTAPEAPPPTPPTPPAPPTAGNASNWQPNNL